MIKTLRKLFYETHVNKISLGKIVRQKSHSFKKIDLKKISFKISKTVLEQLEEKKLIYILEKEIIIILPLGYAFIESEFQEWNVNRELILLRKIYKEKCQQIIEPFEKISFSSLDCILGFFLILNGLDSEEHSFPFVKDSKSIEYFDAIKHQINYLSKRLLYTLPYQIPLIESVLELDYLLNNNSKNGHLKKQTKLHRVLLDRGLGKRLHWFEINDLEKDVENILDSLIPNGENLIFMLNLKKIAMDYNLIDVFPYDLQKKLGERNQRNEILRNIIRYVDNYTKKCTVKNNIDMRTLQEISINLESSYHDVINIYKKIDCIIKSMPDIGIYLIEVHYRLSLTIFEYEKNNNFDELLYVYKNLLGEDFEDLLNHSIKTCTKYMGLI